MFNPISPEVIYVIHQDKIKALEREIELIRIAKEQRAAGIVVSLEHKPAWYARTYQWMKEKLYNRAPVSERASSQQKTFEEPCPVTPC